MLNTLKQTILIFVFLTVALGLTPALEQSLFYFSEGNGVSYELFQTRKGIIAYVIENSVPNPGTQYVPQYILIDVEATNVTPVLEDTVQACGQGNSSFDRVHYHAATQNLVYYCSSNNSLLIIDQDDYTVQSEVSTNILSIYPEAKITSEGYLVAIILTDGLYSEGPGISKLIKISLQSYNVVNNIEFNHGLGPQESVYGYDVDNDNNMFIATYNLSSYPENITQTLYKMTLIGNAYQLTRIASFENTYIYSNDDVYQLYCVGHLIFMTIAEKGMYIMTQEGSILAQPVDTFVTAHGDGSPDVYALVNNTIIRYTVQGAGYTKDDLVHATDMHVAFGNQTSNSLLLFLDENNYFNIYDTETLTTLYQAFSHYSLVMLTNTTYSMLQTNDENGHLNVQVFNRTSKLLITTVSESSIEYAPSYYYNEEDAVLTYMNKGKVMQVDLQTGNVTTPVPTVNSQCFYFISEVIHATNKGGSPQMTVSDGSKCYTIISNAFGQVTFDPDNKPISITVDYDTLSVYAFQTGLSIQGEIDVLLYTYDATTGNFNSPTTLKSFLGVYPTAVYVTGDQAVAYVAGTIGVINIQALNMTTYQFLPHWNLISSFHDQEGTDYTILSYQIDSDNNDYSDFGLPTVFYSGQQEQLYGVNDFTTGAIGNGCTYFVVDTLVSSATVFRFYNACSQENEVLIN